MLCSHASGVVGEKMEIRELNSADVESLLELYVQLDENNKNLSKEKSLEIWKSEIESNKNILEP